MPGSRQDPPGGTLAPSGSPAAEPSEPGDAHDTDDGKVTYLTESGRSFVGDDLGDCPFCGLGIAKPDLAEDDVGILHALPVCDTFEKLDALEFVTAVRKARQRAQA